MCRLPGRRRLCADATVCLCLAYSLICDAASISGSALFAQAKLAAVIASSPAEIPPVLLTQGHERLCRVRVGDRMPAVSLRQLTGTSIELAEMFGNTATVICFWKDDRKMSHSQLADLQADVVASPLGDEVAVIAIAVQVADDKVRSIISDAGLTYPLLIDADGSAFVKVGSEKLPRTYVVDESGTIVWFDIEYSLATRRELRQTLQTLLAE